MKNTLTFSTTPSDKSVPLVAAALREALGKHKRVLWLVSGGSCIPMQATIMQYLLKEAPGDLPRLAVLPIDERYGLCGHPDSNTEQMRQAKMVVGEALWVDPLANNVDFAETTVSYNSLAKQALLAADYVVTTLGMGPDGHIAGMLPGSPALTSEDYVVGYESSDFKRLSLTVRALPQIDQTFLFAYGEAKVPALEKLAAREDTIRDFPALLLYDMPSVTVFRS